MLFRRGMDAASCHAPVPPASALPSYAYERTPGAASRPASGVYRRRAPEHSALHEVVRGHLQTLLDEGTRRNDEGRGYPAFVGREFVRYLDCGQLARGFARLRCPTCGFERLVAFSCKGRICPSCWAPRAGDTRIRSSVIMRRAYRGDAGRRWVSLDVRRRTSELDNAACKLHDIVMTGRELLKVLREAGWQEVGGRGSHHKLERSGRTVIVPVHGNRDIPPGTLHSILRQAGLDQKR